MNSLTLAFFSIPGGIEWIVIAIIALLIFGRKLPEVARSMGKSIVEFKKGIKDVKDDIAKESRLESSSPPKLEHQQEPTTTPQTSNDQKT